MNRSIRCSVSIILLVAVWQIRIYNIHAHSRWGCPKPRDPDTGIKDGPCGSTIVMSTSTSLFSLMNETSIEIPPGPMLVRWEEAVSHTGSPFRISLSGDNNDSDICVLLDHIPHNDESNPNSDIESTYTNYSIIIDIPNVDCERCSLHLANPMTDKEGMRATPTGNGFTDPYGDCILVYHSCTIPIRINGTIPRSEYQCPNRNPIDWPTTWIGDYGLIVNTSQIGVYRRESSTWENSFLMNAPERYRKVDDGLFTCESFTNTQQNDERRFFQRFFSRFFDWFLSWLNPNR